VFPVPNTIEYNGGRDLTKSALVIGGGIAGIQASLDMADRDIHVYLVERDATIGGVMCRLDKTFPTNDCSACILSPKMADCNGHPNVDVLSYSEVIKVEGKAGDFKVTVRKKPRYVKMDECTGCGICIEKCPVKKIPDEYEYGLTNRRAIYIPHAQAVPRVAVIDPVHCRKIINDKCGLCEKACGKGAINYADKEEIVTLEVGSIICATGFNGWDAKLSTEYGYGRFANVVTALEFERMMCASGPSGGHIVCPSDESDPKRIAFIQCCGSRSSKKGSKKYCSSVCCMYATKQAIITKEHADVDEDIFFMDIRSYGKEFESYIRRAEDQYKIKMHRSSRVACIEEDANTKKLTVSYTDAKGDPQAGEYDLVVLSIGLNPPDGAEEFAKILGIELNEYGFCATKVSDPLSTSREGIFVTGAFAAPKDIPTSVAEASGAAGKAGAYIVGKDFVPCAPKVFPPEKETIGKEPRVGVWVCSCGINIGGVVDVDKVTEYAKSLPNVVYTSKSMYACAQDCLEEISREIKEQDLNRVVVAACTPRTHEPLFRNACREGGLNQYLFNMANIRDQCSWIHTQEPEKATIKSKDLLRMTVAKSLLLEPLQGSKIPVTGVAAVIGGGIAGMSTALDIAAQGFPVHLVERSERLGGSFSKYIGVNYSVDGVNLGEFVSDLIKKVESNKMITVHKNAKVKDIPGYVGNFKLQLDTKEYPVGVVVLAVGASEYKPTEYNYGKDGKVMTLTEAEIAAGSGKFTGKDIAFMQCIGSRNEKTNYCSRTCCANALTNAIAIKEADPNANISLFHKDVRTYGFREELYNKAASLGVRFLRYDPGSEPVYDGSSMKAYDTVLGADVEVPVDRVILSCGITPDREEKEELAKMLKVPISKDGFYFEAHQKLRPVDFATEGVFVVGLAHWPKFMDESIAQAAGAAARALTIVSKQELTSEGITASVYDDYCDGCGICMGCCDYNAIEIVSDGAGGLKSHVNPGLCKGCGCCVAACPVSAMEQKGFKNVQIQAEIDACLDMKGGA